MTRGPVPKRSEERRRRNKPENEDGVPIEKISLSDITEELPEYVQPEPPEYWDDFVRGLWDAAQASMFRIWYQPTDWSTLYMLLDDLSREREPKPVRTGGTEDDPEYTMMRLPMPGSKMSAFLKAFNSLLFLEGDRRRLRIELTNENDQAKIDAENVPENVTAIREGLWA